MGEPSSSHLGAAKRVLRYVKGSLDLGIMFERNKVMKLEGYVDNDWAGSIDDSKSTSGYIFTLGSGVFCWNSKKQNIVAQSSIEYISVAGACKSCYLDSKVVVRFGSNLRSIMPFEKLRRIEKSSSNTASETQLADMLAKSITGKKLNYFKARLMKSNNNLKEEC
ncbi:hypothetical protein Tco_0543747 [Tanacetum coccineum]